MQNYAINRKKKKIESVEQLIGYATNSATNFENISLQSNLPQLMFQNKKLKRNATFAFVEVALYAYELRFAHLQPKSVSGSLTSSILTNATC